MENKNTNGKVRRGEIYLYDFGNNEGSIQNGVRPALVVQCDEGNAASSTTIIAAITSVIKKQFLPTHIIVGNRFGLKAPSMVMLEQLKTVNQSDLIEYIGRIDDEHCMKKFNIGIKKALGLWVDKPYRKPSDIRCLCVKCLEDYKSSQNYIVKRLDPFARVKEKCDKCEGYGYDYLVIERSKEGR
jgi:mRNA interferase MazF